VKKLRVLALVHDHLVPPEDVTGIDVLEAEWKMEYDVIETLKEIGHNVRVLGVHDELTGIRASVAAFKPHIVFNLMEAFANITTSIRTWSATWSCCACPTPAATPAG
jgi:D-alanine-D-alanine ligase